MIVRVTLSCHSKEKQRVGKGNNKATAVRFEPAVVLSITNWETVPACRPSDDRGWRGREDLHHGSARPSSTADQWAHAAGCVPGVLWTCRCRRRRSTDLKQPRRGGRHRRGCAIRLGRREKYELWLTALDWHWRRYVDVTQLSPQDVRTRDRRSKGRADVVPAAYGDLSDTHWASVRRLRTNVRESLAKNDLGVGVSKAMRSMPSSVVLIGSGSASRRRYMFLEPVSWNDFRNDRKIRFTVPAWRRSGGHRMSPGPFRLQGYGTIHALGPPSRQRRVEHLDLASPPRGADRQDGSADISVVERLCRGRQLVTVA